MILVSRTSFVFSMDFRTRRQFTIFLLLVMVVAGFGYAIYSAVTPNPTCQDNKKNQDEAGVDCGGSCESCLIRHRKDLEIYWVRFVKIRENAYDVSAEVYNPNGEVGASDLQYEFKLFDESGSEVTSRRNRSFIYPRETMHLVEINLLTDRTVKRVTLAFGDSEWVVTEAIGPDIIVGNREYSVEESNGTRQSVVHAVLSNRTLKDIPEVPVQVLVLDTRGNLLGVHRTVEEELLAGESRPLEFVWPRVIAESAGSLIIEPRSPLFLPAAGQ